MQNIVTLSCDKFTRASLSGQCDYTTCSPYRNWSSKIYDVISSLYCGFGVVLCSHWWCLALSWLTAPRVVTVTAHGTIRGIAAGVMHLLVFSDMITVDAALHGYMCIFLIDILCRNLISNCKIITWSTQGVKSLLVNLQLFTVYHNLSVCLCVFLSMLTACEPKCILVNVEFYHCPCHSYHCLYIGDSSDNDIFFVSIKVCFK